jgi:hypothetical protein
MDFSDCTTIKEVSGKDYFGCCKIAQFISKRLLNKLTPRRVASSGI